MNPPKEPITIEQFNEIWKSHKRLKFKNVKLHVVKNFKLTKRLTKTETTTEWQHGIPFTKTKVVSYREVPDINGLNKAIVAWLQLFTDPLKVAITNTSGKYIPKVGYIPNYADKGRADITAEYQDMILSIETKQKNEKQLESQRKFQSMAANQSFRRYVVVRGWVDFQEQMIEIFSNRML